MQNTHSVESSRHQITPQQEAEKAPQEPVRVWYVRREMAEAATDNDGIFPPKGAIEHYPGYRAR